MSVLARVPLEEIDVELTAIGTMFLHPVEIAPETLSMQADWFSDSLAQYLFLHFVEMRDAGLTPSPSTVIAALPEDCGTMTRGQFYARVCAAGLYPKAFGGLKATLFDRWQRRRLAAIGAALSTEATQFESSPADLTLRMSAELDALKAGPSVKTTQSLMESVEALFQEMEAPELMRGAPTGMASLDKKLNGYRRGQLYVIAGRPGMGKSAFMVSSLRQTAAAGYGVAIFSLEMSGQEIAARAISDAISSIHAPKYGNILKGDITNSQREELCSAKERQMNLPMIVEDASRLTMPDIAARARAIKKRLEDHGSRLAVVCIDHMGLVTPSERYKGNKVAEASEVSAAARAMAKELDVCVVLLCQLSREVEKREDKRPIMSDLRWSGEIEQDAHVVAFLYREHYYKSQDPNADVSTLMARRNVLEFLIRKNRNGETGDTELWCSIAHSSVRDA